MKRFVVSAAWPVWMALLITQTVLSLLLYNPGGNPALRILGWAIGLAAGVLGVWPMVILRWKGGVQKQLDYTHTTLHVDNGIYAVIRHPQYLAFMLTSLFLVLVVQHWLIAVIGIAAMALVYVGIVPQAENADIAKFGDDYRRYMQRVPRVNLVAGIIRLLRRREMDDERR
jgi:protein-S-isoprenylcysteine O-methyltransferase Ste14